MEQQINKGQEGVVRDMGKTKGSVLLPKSICRIRFIMENEYKVETRKSLQILNHRLVL